MDDNMVDRALAFATAQHDGQVRKYTGEPYINHPIAVSKLVASVPHVKSMVIAALLHDVVEDTDTTIDDIQHIFGDEVAGLVDDLTDISKPEDGNRATRKAIDLGHTAKARPNAKTIKLADLIDNTRDIVENDPDFARVYLREKKLLLEVLKDGNQVLWQRANDQVDKYLRR